MTFRQLEDAWPHEMEQWWSTGPVWSAVAIHDKVCPLGIGVVSGRWRRAAMSKDCSFRRKRSGGASSGIGWLWWPLRFDSNCRHRRRVPLLRVRSAIVAIQRPPESGNIENTIRFGKVDTVRHGVHTENRKRCLHFVHKTTSPTHGKRRRRKEGGQTNRDTNNKIK